MFTLVALTFADSSTMTPAELEARVAASHGSVPRLYKMLVRDTRSGEDGIECWASWRAWDRKAGTTFEITTAAGTTVHKFSLPGFHYSGAK